MLFYSHGAFLEPKGAWEERGKEENVSCKKSHGGRAARPASGQAVSPGPAARPSRRAARPPALTHARTA